MNTAGNRRVTMTKRILHETLIDMLDKDNISNISVRALCEEAGYDIGYFDE